MIGAIIGVGPRTGTSRVMQMLTEAGFNTHYHEDTVPDSDRIGGHYETPPAKLHELDNVIAKVWPHNVDKVLITHAVFLVRDRESQIRSIAEQAEREKIEIACAESIIDGCITRLDGLMIPEVLGVRTHEIDDRIDDICRFFMGGGYHATSGGSSRSSVGWSVHCH